MYLSFVNILLLRLHIKTLRRYPLQTNTYTRLPLAPETHIYTPCPAAVPPLDICWNLNLILQVDYFCYSCSIIILSVCLNHLKGDIASVPHRSTPTPPKKTTLKIILRFKKISNCKRNLIIRYDQTNFVISIQLISL